MKLFLKAADEDQISRYKYQDIKIVLICARNHFKLAFPFDSNIYVYLISLKYRQIDAIKRSKYKNFIIREIVSSVKSSEEKKLNP